LTRVVGLLVPTEPIKQVVQCCPCNKKTKVTGLVADKKPQWRASPSTLVVCGLLEPTEPIKHSITMVNVP
jgi:hypothetical protein